MLSVFYNHITEAVSQTGLSMKEILLQVKQAGIDGIEINFDELMGRKEILQELKDAGLVISSIWQFYDFDKNSDSSKVESQVLTAEKLGVNKILVVPGFYDETEKMNFMDCSTKEKAFEKMNVSSTTQNIVKMLNKTVAFAKDHSITVTLEDFDSDNSPCSRMFQLEYLMENVPGLRFTMDTGNFAFNNEDALKAFEVLEPYISHVHCKDRGIESHKPQLENNKGMAAVAVGKGYMPIEKIVRKMVAKGYLEDKENFLAIEHFGAEDQLGCMKESAAYLKEICS